METCAHLASPSLLDCYRYLSAPDCTQQIASPSVQNTSKINAVMQSFPHFSLYVLYERHQTHQHLTSHYRHICENCLCGNQDGSCSLCPGVFPFRVAACVLGCFHFELQLVSLGVTISCTAFLDSCEPGIEPSSTIYVLLHFFAYG